MTVELGGDRPLVVDLDGTLIFSDSLYEAVVRVLRQSPLAVFSLLVALFQGRAAFKEAVALHHDFDAEAMPYNEPLIEALTSAKSAGRQLILATAAHHSIADAVAAKLGLFDKVLATRAGDNVKGANKLAHIEREVDGDFDYIGDHGADRPIWRAAGRAFVVAQSEQEAKSIAGGVAVDAWFHRPLLNPRALVKAVRLHQWAKNLLLFTPLFLSQRFLEPALWLPLIAAFISMGLCASATYLWNDLNDLAADRAHPRKRNRPLASGALPIHYGIALSVLLLVASIAIAIFAVNLLFLALLGLYLVTTVSYSLILKRKQTADVLTLGFLYGLRVYMGGMAVAIAPSPWLLSFSIFFFLSLGFMKRLADIPMEQQQDRSIIKGRGYIASDRQIIMMLGIASGYSAIIIMCLYITDPGVMELYPRPDFLWLVCLTLLYWLARLWVFAGRDEMPDDPVVYAITDRISLLCGLAVMVIILLAGGLI